MMELCSICKKRPSLRSVSDSKSQFCSRRCTFEYALSRKDAYFEYCKLHNMWFFVVGKDDDPTCRYCVDEMNNEIDGYLPGELGE